MVHIISFTFNIILIYLSKKTQIILFITEKVKISGKYSDFYNIFLEKKTFKLPKITELNKHAIKLQEDQHLFYWPIYSLRLVEFKMLKIQIKTNLANSFVYLSKLPIGILIFFIQKPNSSFCLYINYKSLNNLTIKINTCYC